MLLAPDLASASSERRTLDYHVSVVNGSTIGSGFSRQDGVILTAAHVLAGRQRGDTIRLLAPGRPDPVTSATILAISPRMDLALLAAPNGFVPAVVGQVSRGTKGTRLRAAGAIGDRGPYARRSVQGTIVRTDQRRKKFGRGHFAILPGALPGFSGGPVLDTESRLVGMLVALRPGDASSPHRTIAFILSAAAIEREVTRLLRP